MIQAISLNANGMETNPLRLPRRFTKAMQAVVYGDLFMRVLYATVHTRQSQFRQCPA
ncbi:MAG: hypothetical protein ACLS5Z_04800 [Clostridium fessum]